MGNSPSTVYPGDLLQSVTRYVASKVSVSGTSNQSNDHFNGSLDLVSNDLIWSQHQFGINYRDSVISRDGEESSALKLSYGFALSDIDLNMQFETRDQSGFSVVSGNRLGSASEDQRFEVSGRSPWFTLYGLRFNSVFSHSVGTTSVFEDNDWKENSLHQTSKFGLEYSDERSYWPGLTSSTRIAAFSGIDVRETQNCTEAQEERDPFRKVALSASFRQELYNWTFDFGGRYQFANSDLPSSEWFKVAGPSLSYGYNGQSRSVPEGGWLRLQAGSPGFYLPVFTGIKSSFQMSVLRGWTPMLDTNDERSGSASVGQFSVQFASRDFRAAMSVGRMLGATDGLVPIASSPDVSLSLTIGM
jgi:hemolysin activation/secretion protein